LKLNQFPAIKTPNLNSSKKIELTEIANKNKKYPTKKKSKKRK